MVAILSQSQCVSHERIGRKIRGVSVLHRAQFIKQTLLWTVFTRHCIYIYIYIYASNETNQTYEKHCSRFQRKHAFKIRFQIHKGPKLGLKHTYRCQADRPSTDTMIGVSRELKYCSACVYHNSSCRCCVAIVKYVGITFTAVCSSVSLFPTPFLSELGIDNWSGKSAI